MTSGGSLAQTPDGANTRRTGLVDLALAGVLLAVGAIVLKGALELSPGTASDPLGPRGFPSLLAIGLLACGVALAASSVLALVRSAEGDSDAEAEDDEAEMGPVVRTRLLCGAAAIVGYAAVLPTLGFMVSTVLFSVVLILLQGGAAKGPFALTALGLPVVIYLVFSTALGISLPAGVFDLATLWGG